MQYRPLKDFVARKGGIRLAMHGGLRDQLVDMAVAEFPLDAPEDKKVEVLAARLRRRCREQYGSVVAMILIGVLINVITHIIVEWWKSRQAHQVLMYGWQRSARGS
jgi:hypothetical protein